MEQQQSLRNVQKSAYGDFIDFDVQVVDSWRQCRISGSALAMLGGASRVSGLKAFALHEARIQEIAADLSAAKLGGGRLAIISSDI
ncbi:hypothetical protein [Duganella sp. BuS-21]|uniref:hypothetical protein n=1 Tax=Duganella sp. BuS-21 TaxID=2943848 RepID=UPI0035A5E8F2